MHLPDIAHEDWHAVDGGEHDVFDVADDWMRPTPPYHPPLLVIIKERPTGVLIIGIDRLGDVTNGQVGRFSLVCSSRSCFSSRASLGCRPPYTFFQRSKLCSEIPILRHRSRSGRSGRPAATRR